MTVVPAEIGNLTTLIALNLGLNQLTDVPAGIENLTNLIALRLGSNQLTGDVTGSMQPLVTANKLNQLQLSGNGSLSTTGPSLATWLAGLDPNWDDGCPYVIQWSLHGYEG